MKDKTVQDLRANPDNPRSITDERLSQLDKAIRKFGDLSGVVYNAKTGNLVGGHQRIKKLNPKAKVKITSRADKPTKLGTTAVGYIEIAPGERISYREVEWDRKTEKAAMIAANSNAGEFDLEKLSGLIRDLDESGFDLDLTMLSKDDLEDMLTPTRDPNFEPGSEEDQGQLDRKKPVTCPECFHEFVPESR